MELKDLSLAYDKIFEALSSIEESVGGNNPMTPLAKALYTPLNKIAQEYSKRYNHLHPIDKSIDIEELFEEICEEETLRDDCCGYFRWFSDNCFYENLNGGFKTLIFLSSITPKMRQGFLKKDWYKFCGGDTEIDLYIKDDDIVLGVFEKIFSGMNKELFK